MADHQAMGRTGKAAIGDQGHGIAESLADESAGYAEHLAHSRTADRTLVANHDDVASLDLPGAHCFKRRLLAVEDARWATMKESLMAGEFYDTTLGREIAAKDGEATGWLQRLRQQRHDLLAGCFHRTLRYLGHRPAVDRPRVTVDQPTLGQALRHQPDAAGIVQVLGDVLAAGFEAGDHRGAGGHPIEVIDAQGHTRFAGDRE